MLEHTGLYYRFFQSTQSWTGALCSCLASAPRGYSGNLASVHDNITNTFVTSLIPGAAWLGGYQNSNGTEEPWRWSDGSAWDFENWKSGEPNNCCGGVDNMFGEDYLAVDGKGNGMKWNDGGVSNWWMDDDDGYVCQYEG